MITNAYMLQPYRDVPIIYSGNPHTAIEWLLRYNSQMVFKDDDLYHYAKGLQLINNQPDADIILLEPGKELIAPAGNFVYLFCSVNIKTVGGLNSWGDIAGERVLTLCERIAY